MEAIDDLGGIRELGVGDVPDPACTVPEDDLALSAREATAVGLAVDSLGEEGEVLPRIGGGALDGGGVRVTVRRKTKGRRPAKNLQVAEDIMPIGEFKAQASKLIGRVQKSHRPVVITQNGRPAAVLIAPEDFDRFSEHVRFVERVNEGLDDALNDRLVTDKELGEALKNEFG